MKVVYTATARKDLDEIGDCLSDHYPTIAPAVERRIHEVIARIVQWPQSTRRSAKYPRTARGCTLASSRSAHDIAFTTIGSRSRSSIRQT